MTDWRHDPIADRRGIVAPGRDRRPVDPDLQGGAPLDRCPFCPGGESELDTVLDVVEGPDGWIARAVRNRWPFVTGTDHQEVLIESPRHELDFEDFSREEAVTAVRLWVRRIRAARAADPGSRIVLFRNQGWAAGTSRRHPHAQLVVLGSDAAPVDDRAVHLAAQAARSGVCLLCASVAGTRVERGAPESDAAPNDDLRVLRTPHFEVDAVPAPLDPFHVRVVPVRHASSPAAISDEELEDFARTTRRVLRALRVETGGAAWNLLVFDLGADPGPGLHWHVEVRPRASRTAGFEQITGYAVSAVDPAEAARRLRARLETSPDSPAHAPDR